MRDKSKSLCIRNGIRVYKALKAKTPMKVASKKQSTKNNVLNKARKSLRAMAGELCMNCHQPPDFRGLQVHHLKLRSKGGTNDLNNLTLICGDCHDKFHRIS